MILEVFSNLNDSMILCPGLAGELVAGGRAAGQESCMAWCGGQKLLMFVKGFGQVVWKWVFPGLCCNSVSRAGVMDVAPADPVEVKCPLCPQCECSPLKG